MGRRGKKYKEEAQYLNNRTYLDYFNRLTEIALNMFEWKNLPDTVDARFLELMLYNMGYCVYFRDPIIGDLALSCTIGGQLDVYRIPIERRAFANNGYFRELTSADSVLIFNNRLHNPTSMTIELFARRLYEIERAIDVNVRGQKFPIMVKATEQQRLSMLNLYAQYDGNQPFIFTDNYAELDDITAIKTDAPFVSDKLEILKHNIWNEAMSFLGVENSNQDKRERMVADEVGGNVGLVEAQRYTMLQSRRDAVVAINRMFGTNIEVGYNSNLNTTLNKAFKPELERGDDNGLYDINNQSDSAVESE